MVDWMAVTFPDHMDVEHVKALCARGGTWEKLDRGSRGYTYCERWGMVTLSYGGTAGIHVEASGQGCRQLECQEGWNWRERIRFFMGFGCNFTRLDWAFDERCGLVNMPEVEAAVRSLNWVSSCGKWQIIESGDKGSEGRPGRTVYVGSSASDTRVCFYDKAAEQGIEGHHTRCELRVRRERAQMAASVFMNDGAVGIAGMLARAVDFKEVTGRSRLADEKSLTWWSVFLGHCDKVIIHVRPVVKTVESILEWVKASLAPTLGLIALLGGSYEATMRGIAQEGQKRFGPRHRSIMEFSGMGKMVAAA